MLVDMHWISCLDEGTHVEIVDALKQVQLSFKGLPGCLGQRLLKDLEDPDSLILVSYWRDRENLASTRDLHAAIDKALNLFRVRAAMNAYELVQDL
jgi:heme-degrading monooxygenase HmoA